MRRRESVRDQLLRNIAIRDAALKIAREALADRVRWPEDSTGAAQAKMALSEIDRIMKGEG